MSNLLKMTFDPMTIEHLGIKMYSTLPPVISELIANSADAGASHVSVQLRDSDSKEITVQDDGDGMTFQELNEKFLRIGRNRREAEGRETNAKGRKVIGKKGLGKLSFFGISEEIEVVTKKNGLKNAFIMRWVDIKKSGETGNEYSPTILYKDQPYSDEKPGTSITLRGIKRKTDFNPHELATSLSKIFIVDPGFQISITHNDSNPIAVENALRYEALDTQFEWHVPKDVPDETGYFGKNGISGHLMTTEKPIPPSTKMRGIILYSRKKLVNNPEYFSESASSHFFSYLTGWLEVDFIDELPEDVISTDRQSLNWDRPEMMELRDQLRNLIRWLGQDWRKKRGRRREQEMKEKTGIDVPEWMNKVPENIRELVSPILSALVDDSELTEPIINEAAEKLHKLVPEYPHYHWRNLHPIIRDASKTHYERQDYFTAFVEAIKRYLREVQRKTGLTLTDRKLLENVWSQNNPKLSVTSKFKRPDGTDFNAETLKNIREGHRYLAVGIWTACRCPISHEIVQDLNESGLFTEKDCLDALGLVSHLLSRLENSEPVPPQP